MTALTDAIAPVLALIETPTPAEWTAAFKTLAKDASDKTTIEGATLDVIAAAFPGSAEAIALIRLGLVLAPYLPGKDLGAVAPTPYTPGEQIGDLDVDS